MVLGWGWRDGVWGGEFVALVGEGREWTEREKSEEHNKW
jgi:hypothetical protein